VSDVDQWYQDALTRLAAVERERDEAFDRGRAEGRRDVAEYANAIGRIDGALGRCGAKPMAETVAAVEAVIRERDAAVQRAEMAEARLAAVACTSCGVRMGDAMCGGMADIAKRIRESQSKEAP